MTDVADRVVAQADEHRRALPMDLAGPGNLGAGLPDLSTRAADRWVGPIRSDRLLDDQADVAALRSTVGLALLAALQRLPPTQRAVVVLRDVLSWSAAECADVLDTSVVSVNSALARGRRTLAESGDDMSGWPVDPDEALILERYVAAFEAYDVAGRRTEILTRTDQSRQLTSSIHTSAAQPAPLDRKDIP